MDAVKPIWEEGMLVGPEHFRQLERWVEAMIEHRLSALQYPGWGIGACEVDASQLSAGKLAISRCVSVLPDGTPVSWPGRGVSAPRPRDLDATRAGCIVHLALPVRTSDIVPEWEDTKTGSAQSETARYERFPMPVQTGIEGAAMMAGRLQPRLIFDDEPRESFTTVPLLRLGEIGSGQVAAIDDDFVPPCLDCRASGRLTRMISELSGLLRRRAETLALHADPRVRTGQAPLVDFMLLSLCNEFDAAISHLRALPRLHPERLFALLSALSGRLASFAGDNRLAPRFPPYAHDDPWPSLEPIWRVIVQGLSAETAQRAIALTLEDRGYGVRIAPIVDRGLIEQSRFVLTVSADIASETLRHQLPLQLKVGPVEEIRNLVNLQLRGIDVTPLPVAPAELPYHADTVYAELNRSAALWQKMRESSAFAFHFAGDFPGLKVEFWAIRG